MVFSPIAKAVPVADDKPETNLKDALAVPRTAQSMPGKYPGKVVKVKNADCIVDGRPSEEIAYEMLKTCMLDLTGASDLKAAWLQFVGPEDVIGLKVNPIAGKLLSTSHALTKSIVRQLRKPVFPVGRSLLGIAGKLICEKRALPPNNIRKFGSSGQNIRMRMAVM